VKKLSIEELSAVRIIVNNLAARHATAEKATFGEIYSTSGKKQLIAAPQQQQETSPAAPHDQGRDDDQYQANEELQATMNGKPGTGYFSNEDISRTGETLLHILVMTNTI
jgi:hypothetical protein